MQPAWDTWAKSSSWSWQRSRPLLIFYLTLLSHRHLTSKESRRIERL